MGNLREGMVEMARVMMRMERKRMMRMRMSLGMRWMREEEGDDRLGWCG